MRTYKYTDLFGYDTEVALGRGTYPNGTLGVTLLCKDEYGEWEDYGVITVNLCDPRQDGGTAFVVTNNMPSAREFLESNGLATWTGATGYSGYCAYPLYAFTDSFFESCVEL